MGLSKDARDRALRGIVAGKLWLGLAWSVEGKTVREVDDLGYRRQAVTFGDPSHEVSRSTVAINKSVAFPPFMSDAPFEIHNWFLIDAASGGGKVIATGQLDPLWMVDGAGKAYTLAEAAGRKDKLTPFYPRPLAGMGTDVAAGDIWLYIEEGS